MLLLFDAKHAYLGEISLKDGALASMALSAKGEEGIGESVMLWQTHGLEGVQPRMKEFGAVLKKWLGDQGIEYIEIEEEKMPQWEEMLHMKLTPAERFKRIKNMTSK